MQELATEVNRDIFLVAMRILGGLAVFLAFCLLNALLQRITHRLGEHSDSKRRDRLRVFNNLARVMLILIGAICGLATAGVDVSALVAGLGLTGFALGFALRDALSNFLAGALILVYRPFRRGDKIQVKTFEGIVIEIDLRYTTLQGEHKRYLIPNMVLITEPVTIFTPPRP